MQLRYNCPKFNLKDHNNSMQRKCNNGKLQTWFIWRIFAAIYRHATKFPDLPDWAQDNEYLHTSHRPAPTPDFAECFKSILSIHTETGNIWTHLIGQRKILLFFIKIRILGCLIFLFLAIWFWTGASGEHIQLQDKMIFSFFLFGAIFCMGMSFVCLIR